MRHAHLTILLTFSIGALVAGIRGPTKSNPIMSS
jgi:hypothetical protein